MTIEDLLPKEHFDLKKSHGVWSFDIITPTSVDDLPLVTIHVWYGHIKTVLIEAVYRLKIVTW